MYKIRIKNCVNAMSIIKVIRQPNKNLKTTNNNTSACIHSHSELCNLKRRLLS